jgi:thiosulfate/3-mercaptopyruvate sulfurtransferase
MTSPLISVEALRELQRLGQPLVLLDARFDLARPEAGEEAFGRAHLPGARYAHLDRDLCGPTQGPDGRFAGRHPLPERAAFAATLGRWGVTPAHQVVVYDAADGMYAARLWWMLRWMGHEAVRVLDGGLAAWLGHGLSVVAGEARTEPAGSAPPYPQRASLEATLSAAELLAELPRWRVVDARAGERFRGEVEPLDAAAGHIPGARSRFFKDNLALSGQFKSPEELRVEWQPLLAGFDDTRVVHQCGSGVTACHNLLALRHAGLEGGRLYPGSWSEWSSDPARPRARG